MIPPGKGFDPDLRRTIRNEVPMKGDEAPINIRWERFERDDARFFRIDRPTRTIRLNEVYRPEAGDGRRRSVNDTPLIKSLLYLLMEKLFEGEFHGPRDKDNIELWNELLMSAAQAERN